MQIKQFISSMVKLSVSNNIFILMKNVWRIYGRVKALKDISCVIKARDRIAIMGASGSGKSTLMHIMAGLDNPTKGIISWPALGNKEMLRPGNIGFLPQQNSLFPSLSVIENIELPLLFYGYTQENANRATLGILSHMELDIVANKIPSELSGGQSQKAAFARAIATKPKLILADEPTGQLDHKSAKKLFDFIEHYTPPESAVVITTHDPLIAMRMNKIWKMSYGKLEIQ